jgi:hypothetical protein
MDALSFLESFFATSSISFLEAVMLVCWGLSWPVSIIKALRTKIVLGKSPLFILLIAFGYICGISHKILYSRDYLILLYLFNLTMILTDLYLYVRYNPRRPPVSCRFTPAGMVLPDKKSAALNFRQNHA